MRLTFRALFTAMFLLLAASESYATWDPCGFNFGMTYAENREIPDEVNYLTIWAGCDEENRFNNYWHGEMLRTCIQHNKTPVFYAYIIAFAARRERGLQDCDKNSSNNLCTDGANFIRENWSEIKAEYSMYASETANIWGTSEPIIWLMEPDFYQYNSSSQQGGGISAQELGEKMNELVTIIKSHLPNAIISVDISPWIEDQAAWYNNFDMSTFSYANTSGGRTSAHSQYIRANENPTTWNEIHNITGLGIIADDGYGVGGGNTGHDDTWDDVNNLNARIADGVVAITQADPKPNWGATIQQIRPQLDDIITCSDNGGGGGGHEPNTYSLSTHTQGQGSVSRDPNNDSYPAGTSVQLTANANEGWTFSGWSGDGVHGDQNPLSVTVSSDMNITATFTRLQDDDDHEPTYSLSTHTQGQGSVSRNPNSDSYPAGTSVQLTANANEGWRFSGWSGDGVYGDQNPLSVTVNSTMNITATFTRLQDNDDGDDSGDDDSDDSSEGDESRGGGSQPGENILENGDFSSGTDSWHFNNHGAESEGTVENGEFVITIDDPGTAHWNIQFHQYVPLEQGQTYMLSFDAWASEPRSLVANVGQSSGDYASYSGEQEVDLSTSRQTFTEMFTMNEASDNDARFEFNAGASGTGTVYIDNVELSIAQTTSIPKISVPNIPSNWSIGVNGGSFVINAATPKQVELSMYDIRGRLAGRLYNGKITAGNHTITLNHKRFPSGTYIVILRDANRKELAKSTTVIRNR
ncbi:carbohydrate binding domain-containing protein [Chitinispirillales bacterium ANBcel5]|uniref:InlB B-repeat-containing protein n=1 Tax=Cellulosispirillum alkaliphilum TaxID=3039283 RepID=UPI002A4E52EE|nr:carbohydrate binding domain-containing protein [Chitinispirillales bacterium ANBcel5]